MHHDKIALSNAAGGRNLLDHDKRAELPSRRRSNENIDASRTHLNSDLSARKMDPGKAWNWVVAYAQEHAARKLRSNQIVMSEDIIHLPDNWAEVSGGKPDSVFFESVALPFLRGRYGYGENGTENEISAVVHRDEVVKTGPNAGHTTPHLHWKSVPVDRNGKLSHKSVHSRQDLQRLHKDFLRFCESRGYPGLHVYDEERAKAREDALSMPAYKQAMEEADRAAEKASEARKAAQTAERAQKAAEDRKRASEAAAEASEKARKQAVSDAEAAEKDLETQRRRAKQLGPDGEGIDWGHRAADGTWVTERHEKSLGEVRAERDAAQAEADTAMKKKDAFLAFADEIRGERYEIDGRTYKGITGLSDELKGLRAETAAAEKELAAAQGKAASARQAAAQAEADRKAAEAAKAKAEASLSSLRDSEKEARARAQKWQERSLAHYHEMHLTPDDLLDALLIMARRVADVVCQLWVRARDIAVQEWNVWQTQDLPRAAGDMGIYLGDAYEISDRAMRETAEAYGHPEIADDLLDMPEQDQELGYDDWER